MLPFSDVPAENLSSVAVDVSQSEKKLDLEIAAGRIGIIVFDNTEARFALQVFSSHCRFGMYCHRYYDDSLPFCSQPGS